MSQPPEQQPVNHEPAAPPAQPPQQWQQTQAPYPQPYPQYQMQQPHVAAKNPGLALVASFFIPGLGSLINGKVGMGILIFCLYALSLVLIFVFVGLITAPLVWIWGMIDAYQGAKKWNTAHGIVS